MFSAPGTGVRLAGTSTEFASALSANSGAQAFSPDSSLDPDDGSDGSELARDKFFESETPAAPELVCLCLLAHTDHHVSHPCLTFVTAYRGPPQLR